MITADGWFRTGDMGKVDADGFVFVEDRLKDMIISGGENIYSPEVERVIAEHPAVMEVAIIGIPDDTWGEAVKAVVSLHEGAEATADEIIGFCREHLAAFKCPKSVDITGAAAPQPHRQDPQEGPARAVLGGPRPRRQLDRRPVAGSACSAVRGQRPRRPGRGAVARQGADQCRGHAGDPRHQRGERVARPGERPRSLWKTGIISRVHHWYQRRCAARSRA